MAAKPTKVQYTDLKKQVASLQAQAEEARKRETAEVIQRIKGEIQEYGLAPSDIFAGGTRVSAGRSRKPSAAVNGKAAPKGRTRSNGESAPAGAAYRDPQGNTWGGRGPRPIWLRNALAAGKSLAEFRV